MTKQTVVRKHPRFTNEELDLIKRIFAEDDEILKLCYKVFFQSPLTPEEIMRKNEIFNGKELHDILDKFFLPCLRNEQLFFGVENWLDINTEEPSKVFLNIKARSKAIAYIEQQLKSAFGLVEEKIKFADLTDFDGKEAEEAVVNLICYKQIVQSIRSIFTTIQTWAGQKSETTEETMKRLMKDSSK